MDTQVRVSQAARPSMHEGKQSTSPSGTDLLQEVKLSFPKLIARLRGKSHTIRELSRQPVGLDACMACKSS